MFATVLCGVKMNCWTGLSVSSSLIILAFCCCYVHVQGSETERVVAVLKLLEEKTGYKRGKGVKTKFIVEVKKV